MTSPYLETHDLACERDWRMLFERLDLRLGHGEMLQVAGPNGSGKTSLLRLLCGLMQPTAGEVRLKGVALAGQRGELARELLWIGHAAGIKGLLSPEENLAWLCALHQPASRDAIWQALEAVGLRGFEDVPCHTLSAGQQRRVAWRACTSTRRRCGSSTNPSPPSTSRAWRNEEHLAQHCDAGGLVVFTTHHSMARVPAGYRELDLGRRAA